MAKVKTQSDPALTQFVTGYLEAALWASSDEKGPLDDQYKQSDFSKDAIEKAISDCGQFMKKNRKDLEATGVDDWENGKDFWLTRNGHGSGFWDRGNGEVGDRLTEAAHGFGETYVYAGDDGKLYLA